MDDLDLLKGYVEDRDQEAFAQLVGRHGGWLYSAARRRLGDGHLAEDVTQAVFLLLSRRAGRLRGYRRLSGWLFVTLGFCVKQAKGKEAAVKRREQEVASMRPESVEQAPWDDIAPLLESAVGRLGKADRDAVLLRFYEQKPLAEVGRLMGVSEEAARKRVDRAVEKLRGMLEKQGVTGTSAGLSAVLVGNVVQEVPARVVEGVMSAVGGGGSAVAGGIAQGAAKMMILGPLKVAAIAAGCLLALEVVGVEVSRIAPAQVGRTPATAATTAPALPVLAPLTRDVICVDRQGRPVAGAEVFIRCAITHGGAKPADAVSMHGPVMSDANGNARFSDLPDVTVDDRGWRQEWYARVPGRMVGIAGRAQYGKLDKPRPGPLQIGLVDSGTIKGRIVVPEGFDAKTVALCSNAMTTQDGLIPGGSILFGSDSFGQIFHYAVGADGSFAILDAPRDGRLHLVATGPGLGEMQWMGGASDTPPTLKMKREALIEGAVTYGATGQPASGVTVSVGYGAVDGVYYRHDFTAVSGADGRYTIKGLREGFYHVSCPPSADWVMAPHRNVQATSGEATQMPLQFEHGAIVKVKVVEQGTNRPIPGVTVDAITADSDGLRIGDARANEDGQCQIRVPTGKAQVYYAGGPDYHAATGPDSRTVEVQAGQTEAEATLWLRARSPDKVSGFARARGRVVDGSGKPVPNLAIGDSAVERWDERDMPTDNPNAGKTDAQGRYDFPMIAGIKHKVHASGSDYDSPQSREFVPKADIIYTVEDLVVHPRPIIGYITGLVVDPSGKPVRGALIGYPSALGPGNETRTNEAGEFRYPVRQSARPEVIEIAKAGYERRNWNDVPPNGANLVFILYPTDDPSYHLHDDPLPRASDMVGRQAPGFEVERWVFNGSPVPTPVRSDGKDTLLLFPWSCNEPAESLKMIKYLDRMAAEQKAAAVCIFGTSCHESGIRAALRGYQPTAAIGIDEYLPNGPSQSNRMTLNSYGLGRMPQLVVISADGTVRQVAQFVAK